MLRSLPVEQRMFEKLLAHRDHIPPHRLWTFLSAKEELSLPENVHLVQCEVCRAFHDICLHSKNFAEALGMWVNANTSVDPPNDSNSSSEALTTLLAARERLASITRQLTEANASMHTSGKARRRYEELQKEWEAAFTEFRAAIAVKNIPQDTEAGKLQT